MSLRKLRYHHEQVTGHKKYRGFSVKYWPHETDPTLVNYSIVFCSVKEQFCRKKARQELESKRVFVRTVVEFPTSISSMVRVFTNNKPERNRYTWMWKYFL